MRRYRSPCPNFYVPCPPGPTPTWRAPATPATLPAQLAGMRVLGGAVGSRGRQEQVLLTLERLSGGTVRDPIRMILIHLMQPLVGFPSPFAKFDLWTGRIWWNIRSGGLFNSPSVG